MTVRVNKPEFNLREKLTELERPIGLKGSELMRAETTQEARDFIGAGRKNLVINGDMRVSQRNGDNYTVGNFGSSGLFIVDRFRGYNTNGVARGVQSTNSPFGFSHSLKYEVTTANSPRTSTAWSGIYYIIEGYDATHLKWNSVSAGKPAILSFWVRSSVVGKYSVHVRDPGATRSFAVPYFINEPDIWEHKKITIIPPNSGTFGTSNDMAFSLFWSLEMGSNTGHNTTSLGYWETNGNKFGVEGMAPFFSTAGNAFYMTGVQLEVGKNATEFEHCSYGEELALCKRYYQRMGDGSASNEITLGGYSVSGIGIYHSISLPVEMRVVPTLSQVGTFYTVRTNQPGSLNGHVGRKGFGVAHTTTGTGSFLIASSASNYFVLDAEL